MSTPSLRLGESDAPVVLDGGLATELERQGHDLSGRLWSAQLLVSHPEAIAAAHRAFYRAGAQIATTASYQVSFEGFARAGFDADEVETLLRRSVALADDARMSVLQERPDVALSIAASVGPYGAMLADGSEYTGDYGVSDAVLRRFHQRRLEVLADAGADVLAIETLPCQQEAEVLVDLLDRLPLGVSAWLSYSCANEHRTRHGERVEQAFAVGAASSRIIAIGANCTAPLFIEALARTAAATGKPAVVYPNSGEGWDAQRRTWTAVGKGAHADGASVETLRTYDGGAARRWVASGARLVGGCCRVTPEQIADIAGSLQPIGESPAGFER